MVPARCTFVLGLHECFKWQGVLENAKFQFGIRTSNISMLKVQGLCEETTIQAGGGKRLESHHESLYHINIETVMMFLMILS